MPSGSVGAIASRVMKPTAFLFGATLSGAMALGCSGGSAGSGADASFPAAAFSSMTSVQGGLNIEVRTAPSQPPPQGIDTVEYVITSGGPAGGVPQDGLALTVVPWMPDMGHGASITPTVTAMGDGHYVIADVELFMPGTWELRTTIAGPLEDSVAPSFQIP